MKNKNALVALAYIKENTNPFIVFCNYVLYCLQISERNELRHDELLKKIESEFGLLMPNHMIMACIRLLSKEKKIIKLKNGAGYRLINSNLNIEEFDSKRKFLEEKEKQIINKLIGFSAKFKKIWDYNQARDYLTDFFVDREYAADIFANGKTDILTIKPANNLNEEFYVGKFIEHIRNDNIDSYNYLVDIINGLMVYIGVHGIEDYNQNKNQKFHGTDFYLDTRFLLRAMGYSWELEVTAAKELLNMITNEYNGNICVFEHNVREVEYALSTAEEALINKQEIANYELNMYSKINKINSFDFEVFRLNARSKIAQDLKVQIKPSIIINDYNRKYHLSTTDLENYLRSTNLFKSLKGIQNDVDSINYINILRGGNYSVKYGGKDRLPVFITTNHGLIKVIGDYVKEHGEKDIGAGIANWKLSSLPIISDYFLMCRLWTPNSKSLNHIPKLTLSRNAYAAQQASPEFFDRLKNTVKEFSQKHNVSLIDLSELQREHFEELIITNTVGMTEAVTEEAVATTFNELVEMQRIGDKVEIEKLKADNEKQRLINDKIEQQIIKSVSSRFENKIGLIGKLLICSCESAEYIAAGLFVIINFLLTFLKNITFISVVISAISFLLISVFIKVIERKILKKEFSIFLLRKIMPFVWKKYKDKIIRNLDEDEKKYLDQILDCCIQKNSALFKHTAYYKK